MKTSYNNKLNQQGNTENKEVIPIFGYELLRDILIPDLLGRDSPEISYWAGKHLARKFPLLAMEEIYSFFTEASWGNLELIEENKKEMQLQLTGTMVARRMQTQSNPCFRLEAGFLAQQIESKKKCITEAHGEINKKKNQVLFTVRWDSKDPVD